MLSAGVDLVSDRDFGLAYQWPRLTTSTAGLKSNHFKSQGQLSAILKGKGKGKDVATTDAHRSAPSAGCANAGVLGLRKTSMSLSLPTC